MTVSVQNPRRPLALRFRPPTDWCRKRPMVDAVIIKNGRHERNYWRDIWRYLELYGLPAREWK